MRTVLLVIAHRAQTKFFLGMRGVDHLELIETLENQEGRMKEGELVSDSPGCAMKGVGMRRMAKEQVATSHVAEQYARSITDKMLRLQRDHPERKMILIAEPGFLGTIKKSLAKTEISLFKTLSKELNKFSEQDLFQILKEDIYNACFK